MLARKLFLDLYGTLTTGDKAMIAAVCRDIARDHSDLITQDQLSEAWSQHIWRAIALSDGDRFSSLIDLEAESLQQAAADLGLTIDPHSYVARLEEYWQRPEPQPDVAAFFEQLAVPVCIVTNADRANAESALEHLQVKVNHLVTSEDARSYKPNTRVFRHALDQTGWSVDDVVHVGDSVHGDVGPALEIGIRAVLIKRPERLSDPGGTPPDHSVDDLFGVFDFLDKGATESSLDKS